MKFYFLLLSILTTTLLGQTKQKETIKIMKDSIDYQSFLFDEEFTHFELKKIRQFKGQDIYNVSGTLHFWKWNGKNTDSLPSESWPFLYDVRNGDTTTPCSWDRDTKEVIKTSWHHSEGVIKLDQKRNVLYLTKDMEDPKTKNKYAGTKKFKILMWTKDQIILKDITKGHEEFNRIFFFVRRPLPYN